MSLTAKRLREYLTYDHETGDFTWIKQKGAIRAGKVVSTVNAQGYRVVCIDGTKTAHRLAWLYMTGEMPKGDIDHVNGDRQDNRFCNLRDVPRAVNLQNRRSAQSNSVSGVLGVQKNGKKFSARICLNGKTVYLGSFPTVETAHAIYANAKRAIHVGCTI